MGHRCQAGCRLLRCVLEQCEAAEALLLCVGGAVDAAWLCRGPPRPCPRHHLRGQARRAGEQGREGGMERGHRQEVYRSHEA